MTRNLGKQLLLGVAGAYAASKVMNEVTTYFMKQQSDSSKQREEELQKEPSYTKLIEKMGEAYGRKVDEQQAGQLGTYVHKALGLSGGPVAGYLSYDGFNPLAAGLVTGLAMWALVDEAMNPVLGLTPAATAYPFVTHVRGFVGHAAYGLTLGAFLAAGTRLLDE